MSEESVFAMANGICGWDRFDAVTKMFLISKHSLYDNYSSDDLNYDLKKALWVSGPTAVLSSRIDRANISLCFKFLHFIATFGGFTWIWLWFYDSLVV